MNGSNIIGFALIFALFVAGVAAVSTPIRKQSPVIERPAVSTFYFAVSDGDAFVLTVDGKAQALSFPKGTKGVEVKLFGADGWSGK